MKLELTPEVEAGLLAQAQESGMSLEAFIEQVLREKSREAVPPSGNGNSSPETSEPFWESFTREIHALPDEVFDRLQEDGASQVDHYIYGLPRRD
jgi:hypothetical protein